MQRSEIVVFAVKALSIYIGWYLLYDLWLLPDGRLDEALSVHIVNLSSSILSVFGLEAATFGRIIMLPGTNGIEIVDGCNGIEAIGLFVGFVVAYPGEAWKRYVFIPLGIFIIYVVNVSRIIVLTVTQLKWPAFFDFTHDYTTTSIFYIVIFLMWVVWVNWGSKRSSSDGHKDKGIGVHEEVA